MNKKKKVSTQGDIYTPKKFENLCGCDWVLILIFPFLSPQTLWGSFFSVSFPGAKVIIPTTCHLK